MCLSLCLADRAAGRRHDTERRRWMLVCWAGMGLSLLAKGLIGISCRAVCWCCIRCSAATAASGGVCTSALACRCSC
jgi:hypothetical protein